MHSEIPELARKALIDCVSWVRDVNNVERDIPLWVVPSLVVAEKFLGIYNDGEVYVDDEEYKREVDIFIEIDNGDIESVRVIDNPNLVKMIKEEAEYRSDVVNMHHFVREIEGE